MAESNDVAHMARAIARAEHSRLLAPPNPWVGAVLIDRYGVSFEGRTQRPGGMHAERVVLERAGHSAEGATLYTTLEPCCSQGRTGPCTEAIIEAGVERVVVGVSDPDAAVSGLGIAQLETAGVEVVRGVCSEQVEQQLRPYLHHRRTGLPWVVLKLASTLDGQTAAADGTSQWITGSKARRDAHHIRAQSDAILVGAGTVRDDDPKLTVRQVLASDGLPPRTPLRVVLGRAAPGAAIWPCQEMSGPLQDVLAQLGSQGIVQLMVEGGASVAGAFHQAGLVNQYVMYLAPSFMGGSDGRPVLDGAGASSIGLMSRGRFERITQLGDDLRVDLIRRSEI